MEGQCHRFAIDLRVTAFDDVVARSEVDDTALVRAELYITGRKAARGAIGARGRIIRSFFARFRSTQVFRAIGDC